MSTNNGHNKAPSALDMASEALTQVTNEVRLAKTKADLDHAVHRLEQALANYRTLREPDVQQP